MKQSLKRVMNNTAAHMWTEGHQGPLFFLYLFLLLFLNVLDQKDGANHKETIKYWLI